MNGAVVIIIMIDGSHIGGVGYRSILCSSNRSARTSRILVEYHSSAPAACWFPRRLARACLCQFDFARRAKQGVAQQSCTKRAGTLFFAMLKVAGITFLFGLAAVFLFDRLGGNTETEVPKLVDTNWGPLTGKKHDDSVRPYKINVSKEVIDELRSHLERKRNLVAPLEETGWEYGISGKYMETVIEYWRTKYDWRKREALLNKYPQFMTNIQGLDIHFYHVKPSEQDARKARVIPMLLAHGWPGSIVEFQKLIPLLTTVQPGRDFVFEVIAPSLPGYGFSEGAVRPGLATAQMGVIFKNLMTRLGFKKFYTQGGDWGSIVTASMASMYPDRVLGSHSNMCYSSTSRSLFYKMLAVYFPSLLVDPEYTSRVYPLSKHLGFLVRESGYMHLQATKPDTIGNALSESPVALAGYILEKFSTWTNPDYVKREDGGLLEKYTMDELLDNVMVYWVTNSITTSMRLYAEDFSSENRAHNWDSVPIKVPTACTAFPYELVYHPEKLLKLRYKNLVQYTHFSQGGHFPAFEVPKLLADDFWTFVEKVEKVEKVDDAGRKL